jgi:glutamine synthetase
MGYDEVMAIIRENGVEVIRLLFCDVLGRMKGLSIAVDEIDRAVEEGIAFDGSSVEGFVRIEESDLIAVPDLDTFRIFPFQTGGVLSAMFICDVHYPNGQPLETDPRRVLKRALDRANQAGFDNFFVGPELEYFYFPDEYNAKPLDAAGYFDVMPLDRSAEARKRTLSVLRSLGISMEASHHEVAPSQHEIDYRYTDALTMADQIMISKLVVKEVAREHGIYASFMPKPMENINGSGMHVHQSLFTGDTNRFYSAEDEYNISAVGRQYIAGLLRHAREITSVTNQWVNSYKRLIPGYEAPAYITWGRRNRSALVRVPALKIDRPNSCRVEYRAPDAAANPYLAFAVLLSAGLHGIEHEYDLPKPMEADVFRMSGREKTELAIHSLPGDLFGAAKETSKSALVRDTLGEELFDKFLANKFEEWNQYRIRVTDYELKTYLPVL